MAGIDSVGIDMVAGLDFEEDMDKEAEEKDRSWLPNHTLGAKKGTSWH